MNAFWWFRSRDLHQSRDTKSSIKIHPARFLSNQLEILMLAATEFPIFNGDYPNL